MTAPTSLPYICVPIMHWGLHRPEAHQILMAETLPLIGNADLTTGRRHEALS